MKLSRDWATPLTIGSFVLMAVTGVLMFFHADMGLNKLAHEWLGLVMVAGVGLHAAVNWLAFKRHLLASRTGQVLVGVFAVVLVASFLVPERGRDEGGPPPMLAMRAVMNGTLQTVAPLTGRSVQDLQAALQQAGFKAVAADQPLGTLTNGDFERDGQLLGVLFGGGGGGAGGPGGMPPPQR